MMETHHYESEYNTLYNMNSGRDSMKRKMTLDLNSSQGLDEGQQSSVIKKARLASLQTPGYSASDVLNSPGFKNLATPDLEYAMQTLFPGNTFSEPVVQQQRQLNGYNHVQNVNPPPTYSLLVAPTTTYTTVTSQYAPSASSGDSDDNSVSDNSMTSSTNSTYTTNGQYGRLPEYTNVQGYATGSGVVIKEEPMSSPHPAHSHSPIDMANQEKIKLERKRQRNRVAASKCRKRKLEKISKLEEKVNQLKKENAELTGVMDKLNDGVRLLKEQVRRHAEAGCQIMVSASMNNY